VNLRLPRFADAECDRYRAREGMCPYLAIIFTQDLY